MAANNDHSEWPELLAAFCVAAFCVGALLSDCGSDYEHSLRTPTGPITRTLPIVEPVAVQVGCCCCQRVEVCE